MYRDDREAARARVRALIVRQERTVEQLREQLAQIDVLRGRLERREMDAGERPTVDLATTAAGDIDTLEPDALVAAADAAEARAGELDRELEHVSGVRAALDDRLHRKTPERVSLSPPPRRVPIANVLAESVGPVAALMKIAFYFPPLLAMPLISPRVALITVGGLVVLSILASFRRLQMLRWGVLLDVVAGDIMEDRNGELVQRVTLTLPDGTTRELVLEGEKVRCRELGFLAHARERDRVFPIGMFSVPPVANLRGRWTGRIGIGPWIKIALVVGWLTALVVLALLGVHLPM